MFCPHCGTENAENVWSCQACGAPLANPYEASVTLPGTALPTGQIFNWLVPAIIVTVVSGMCSCVFALPCGIVAIVYAAQVNGQVRANQIAQAARSARLARNWCLAACGVYAGGILFYIAFFAMNFVWSF